MRTFAARVARRSSEHAPAAAVFCSVCGIALREDAVLPTPTEDRQERRVVTVLFADLGGSTALGGHGLSMTHLRP